jgi:hypothetical protein
MRLHTLSLATTSALFVTTTIAAPVRFVCENWHPRLGQVNDATFLIDVEQQVCNGQKCRITDDEFKWSEQGERYEFVINRKTGEGHVYYSASAEKTALLKACRAGDK